MTDKVTSTWYVCRHYWQAGRHRLKQDEWHAFHDRRQDKDVCIMIETDEFGALCNAVETHVLHSQSLRHRHKVALQLTATYERGLESLRYAIECLQQQREILLRSQPSDKEKSGPWLDGLPLSTKEGFIHAVGHHEGASRIDTKGCGDDRLVSLGEDYDGSRLAEN